MTRVCRSLVQLLPCHFYHAFFAIYRGYWFGLRCTWWNFYQSYITNFLMNVFVDKSIARFIIYLYWITMNLLVVNRSLSRIIYFFVSLMQINHSILYWMAFTVKDKHDTPILNAVLFLVFCNFSLVECRVVLHAHRLGKLLLFTWLYE